MAGVKADELGALVEQAVMVGLTQIVAVVFVVGLVVEIAMILAARRTPWRDRAPARPR
jgi:hypothetical protein